MNDSQQIFAVFYAIFWGGIFNVLSRWKPFNFGLIFDKQARHITRRIGLAILILNILPIIYFGFIFAKLSEEANFAYQTNCWLNIFLGILYCINCIIPAFAIFGFYRLWLSIIEVCPRIFYVPGIKISSKYKPYYGAEHEPEPPLEKLGIEPSNVLGWKRNLITGIAYIILGIFLTLNRKYKLQINLGIFFILILFAVRNLFDLD